MRRCHLLASLVLSVFAMAACADQAAPREADAAPQPSPPPEPLRNPGKLIHLVVALCDNQFQGIVPVPARIGNGDDPANNLYWGAAFGVETFFRKAKEWSLLAERCRIRSRACWSASSSSIARRRSIWWPTLIADGRSGWPPRGMLPSASIEDKTPEAGGRARLPLPPLPAGATMRQAARSSVIAGRLSNALSAWSEMVASLEFCELSAFIHTHWVPLPARVWTMELEGLLASTTL